MRRACCPCMVELAGIKKKYEKFAGALDEVAATGYGIVMPTMEELHLEEPEIMKQGGRYGIRLRASAPSIHLMQANITTEVAPIVGSERQRGAGSLSFAGVRGKSGEDMGRAIFFGKSLHEPGERGPAQQAVPHAGRCPHEAAGRPSSGSSMRGARG